MSSVSSTSPPIGWKDVWLKDITEKIGSGITPRGGSDVFVDHGVMFIRSQNVKNGKVDVADRKYITPLIDQQMSSSRLKKNDVLYNITGASIGRSAVYDYDEPANVNQHVCIVRLKNDNPYFINHVLSSAVGKRLLWSFQAGGNREGLNFKQLGSFKILIPDLDEQKRIVTILGIWDQYLEKLDKKIELKQNIKRGLIQRLLVAGAGWKSLQIDELFSFVPTGNHGKEVMSYAENVDKKSFNIHYGDIHTRFSEYVDLSNDSGVPYLLTDDSKNHMLLQNGDLVVADASEDYDGVGSCVELKNVDGKKCIAGLHTFALRPRDNKIAPGFAKLVLKVPETANWLKRVSTYSKVYGVSKFNFSKTMVSIPDYSKQQEIVSILDSADDELSLLDKKRAVIKEQKKYLLNTLVNGRIRTPENLTMPVKEVQNA